MIIADFKHNIIANFTDSKFLQKSQYDLENGKESISTTVASINTREIQEISSENTQEFTLINVPDQFRIDAQPFINRPFFVTTISFPTSKVRGDLLVNTVSKLPGDVIRSNPTLLNGLKMGSLYRSKMKLNISMAGTITHAGCVLVGILPPLSNGINYTVNQIDLINTALTGPHAFLHANEATSVAIDIPWYCNTDLATLDMDETVGYSPSVDITEFNGNYGTLVAIVMNPLQPSTGSSDTLSIVVEAIFENLDILIPTPRYITWSSQAMSMLASVGTSLLSGAASKVTEKVGDVIDNMASKVLSWTGLHNPSTAALTENHMITGHNRQNNIDSVQFFEKLDPRTHYDRIVDRPIFNTFTDEMTMKHIISKRQYVTTFRVNVNDAVGTRLLARPISPYQGGVAKQQNISSRYNERVNNIELMHLLSRAWKGSLKIIIQSVMNNKQQVKLRLLQYYNPSVTASVSYPTYNSLLQAPSHLMEFTGGGQEQEVVLPCLSRNELVQCSRDTATEALIHGLYYVYLAQPLANSGGSPTDIYFNVYMSCEDDFTFHGYSTEIVKSIGPFKSIPGPALVQNAALLEQLASVNKENSNLTIKELAMKVPAFENTQELIIAETFIKGIQATTEEVTKIISLEEVPNMEFDDSLDKEENLRRHVETVVTQESYKSLRGFLNGVASSMWSPQSVQVMNEPQKQTNSVNDSMSVNMDSNRLVPILHMRDFVRRMYVDTQSTIANNVQTNATITKTFALNGYLGEGTNTSSTVISAVSRMFYGKHCGLKMRFQVENNVSGTNRPRVNILYCPQNMYAKVGAGLVLGSQPTTPTAISDYSPLGNLVPVPYITIPLNENTQIYEFEIPNTSIFKYVGGPNKLNKELTALNYLATEDCGFLIVTITNFYDEPIVYKLEVSVGLTDESRMGFHSIAPVVTQPVSSNNRYITSSDGSYAETTTVTAPLAITSNFLYYTRT